MLSKNDCRYIHNFEIESQNTSDHFLWQDASKKISYRHRVKN
jgi:hypothetical protein